MVSLFDCFVYNGEPIVEFRLKSVIPYVTHIYISESRFTDAGARKNVLYTERDAAMFKPYEDKITFLIVEEFKPKDKQRDYVRQYLLKNSLSGLFMVCDVDEIVNPTVLLALSNGEFKDNAVEYFEMANHYYNWQWRKKYSWYAGFVTSSLKESFSIVRLGVTLTRPITLKMPAGDWPIFAQIQLN